MKKIYILFLLILISILLIFILKFLNTITESFEENEEESLGFFITRHVSSEDTNKYWNYNVKLLRKHYPKNKIIIIDDNSNQSFIKELYDSNIYENVEIINSEYPKSAELLPYLYFYKLRPFDRMIYLHDSAFLNEKLNYDKNMNCQFLLYTNESYNKEIVIKHINALNHSDSLLNTFHENTWFVCWGVMTTITIDYLVYLVDKYDIFKLEKYIKNREERIALETTFGIIIYNDKNIKNLDFSIYGHANDYNPHVPDNIIPIDYCIENENKYNFIKIFTGR